MQYGKCTNFDLPCPKYVSKEPVAVAEGADFVCPECGRELMAVKPKGQLPWQKIAAGVAAFLLIGGGVYGIGSVLAGPESEDPSRAEREEAVADAPIADAPTEQRQGAVVDFEPPEDWPDPKRELATHLVLGSGLPAGKVYREEAAADVRAREAALGAFEERWEAVRTDVEAFRAEALRGVPPRCTKDTAPLLKEVVALTSECPRISGEARRNDCFLRRDRLNSEIGECETQNRLHQEGVAKANRAIADYRGKRLEAFRRELERQARAHGDEAGGYASLTYGG